MSAKIIIQALYRLLGQPYLYQAQASQLHRTFTQQGEETYLEINAQLTLDHPQLQQHTRINGAQTLLEYLINHQI